MSKNYQNEAALLGGIMREPARFEAVRELLTVADFEWDCYGWAWQAFEKLHAQGMMIDVVTVGDELERANKLTGFTVDGGMFTGRAALSEIRKDGNPRAIETYATKMLDYSAKRELMELAPLLATWSANGRTAHDIISDMSQRLSKIKTFDSKASKHTMTMAEAVSGAYDYTDKASRGGIKTVK